MPQRYTEISIDLDGRTVACEVSNRWLDQVATIDDLHTAEEYWEIAWANKDKIRAALRTKISSGFTELPVRLNRTDFPART